MNMIGGRAHGVRMTPIMALDRVGEIVAGWVTASGALSPGESQTPEGLAMDRIWEVLSDYAAKRTQVVPKTSS